jgi:signal transduction histidine kinase
MQTSPYSKREANDAAQALLKQMVLSVGSDDYACAAQAGRQLVELLDALPLAESLHMRRVCGASFLGTGRLLAAAEQLIRATDDAEMLGDTVQRALIASNLAVLVGLCGQFEFARQASANSAISLQRLDPAGAAMARRNVAWMWLWEAGVQQSVGDERRAAECLAKAQDAAQRLWAQPLDPGNRAAREADCDLVVAVMLKLGREREARAAADALGLMDTLASPAGQPQQPTSAGVRLTLANLAAYRSDVAQAIATLQPDDPFWRRCGVWHYQRKLDLLIQIYAGLRRPAEQAAAQAERLDLAALLAHQQSAALLALAPVIQSQRNARDDNLAYMVHDVRAPLHHIIATLKDGDPATRISKATRVAERTLGRLEALIRYSRLDTLTPSQQQTFDPGSVIDDACEELSLLAEQRGLALERDVQFGLLLCGHRDAILRAAVNLIDNALKASPEGASVAVHCGADEDGLLFSVADQGPGMPLSAQALLGAQGHGTAGHASPPLLSGGFGLRYVARVARMHDARVAVRASHAGTVVMLRFALGGDSPAETSRP